MKNLIPNIQFSEVFGTYWMSYCLFASFCSVFLLGIGYSNTEIGILVAIANLLSVLIQPVMANIADRSRRISVFGLVELSCIAIMVFEIFTWIIPGKSAILFIAYTLMYALHAALQPLLNSMNMTLASRGIWVDYGICRGMGSLLYSIMSIVLSWLVAHFGVHSLPPAGELTMAALLAGMLLLSRAYHRAGSAAAGSNDPNAPQPETTDISMGEFLRHHKFFLIMNIGIFLMYYHHQVMNYYMLQVFQNVNGTSSDMGLFYSLMTILELPALWGFPLISKRFSTTFLLKLGAISFIIRAILMLLARNPLMVYLSLIMHPTSFPLFLPAIVKYINEIMEPGEAVRGQSVYVIVITLCAMVTSFTGGLILDHAGATMLLIVSVVTSILGAALVLPMISRAREE